VPDLIAAIETYLAAHNNDPKPFVWTPPQRRFLPRSDADESHCNK